MKRLKLDWNKVHELVKEYNINSFNRMALCFPINEFNKGIKKNPFTIFDHQKNCGNKLGYQKEGIQLNLKGNPNNLDFDFDEIFIPI